MRPISLWGNKGAASEEVPLEGLSFPCGKDSPSVLLPLKERPARHSRTAYACAAEELCHVIPLAQESPGWHGHPAYATNAPLAHLLHAAVPQAHFLDAAVSILSPPRPSLSTTKGGAPVGAPPLETTPGCLQEGGKTPWPHFVAATGFVCLGLPLGGSCRAERD